MRRASSTLRASLATLPNLAILGDFSVEEVVINLDWPVRCTSPASPLISPHLPSVEEVVIDLDWPVFGGHGLRGLACGHPLGLEIGALGGDLGVGDLLVAREALGLEGGARLAVD